MGEQQGAAAGEEKARWQWVSMAAALVMTAVVYRTTLGFGLVGDANFLIRDNQYLRHWADFWPNVTHDYFWSSGGQAIPYWRPFTKASWLVEQLLLGGGAWGFHLVQLAWHLVAVAGVHQLARRLGVSAVGAGCAALLFGLHPIAAEPVCLVMARSDVVCAAGVVWSLAAWLAWTPAGGRRWAVLHGLALGVALASKEQAVTVPAVLAAVFALRVWRGTAPRSDAVRLLPAAVMVAVYLCLRTLVVHGHGAVQGGLDGVRVLVSGGRYLAATLPLRVESGIFSVPRGWAATPGMMVPAACAWAVALGLLAWTLRQRSVDRCLLGVWALASLAPVLLQSRIPIPGSAGKLVMADRWALQASMAASILWASLVEALPWRTASRAAAAACVAWAVLMGVIAGPRLAPYASDDTMLDLEDQAWADTPDRWRTPQDRCRHVERQMSRAYARGDLAAVVRSGAPFEQSCPDEPQLAFNLLAVRVQTRQWADARRQLDATHGPLMLNVSVLGAWYRLVGTTLVETGDPVGGESALAQAATHGASPCALAGQRAHAEALLGRPAGAARTLEDAWRCSVAAHATDPGLQEAAATWWDRAGRPDEARRVRGSGSPVPAP